MCDPVDIWYNYAPGAFSANCTKSPDFTPDKFPNDHLKDLFNSFQGIGGGADPPSWTYTPADGGNFSEMAAVTLIATRERGEHSNMFHATTDFLNMFLALQAAGVLGGAAGSRRGMEGVQLLLLDEQRGPFEQHLLQHTFSPAGPILRVSALRAGGARRVRLRRAVFAPPGYTSILLARPEMVARFAGGGSHGYCALAGGSRLLHAFRRFVLGGMGILPEKEEEGEAGDADLAAAAAAAAEGGRLRVTLLSRRPYTCASVEHSYMSRQMANEEELLARLRAAPGMAVTRRDFACRPLREQVRAVGDVYIKSAAMA
jgi:protein O-GlcNAc transferase